VAAASWGSADPFERSARDAGWPTAATRADSRLPVKRIAHRRGFGSEKTMRRSSLRVLAVTLRDYGSRFRF
jgi:hypothetical protein